MDAEARRPNTTNIHTCLSMLDFWFSPHWSLSSCKTLNLHLMKRLSQLVFLEWKCSFSTLRTSDKEYTEHTIHKNALTLSASFTFLKVDLKFTMAITNRIFSCYQNILLQTFIKCVFSLESGMLHNPTTYCVKDCCVCVCVWLFICLFQ